jgi:hypothetical protein
VEGYHPAGVIHVGRGKKLREIIGPLFAMPIGRGVKSGLRRARKNNKMATSYYNPEKSTAFSTLDKLTAAFPKKNKSDVKAWLQYQDAYTMHRPAMKRFLRNLYTVSNLMDIWECDILDMKSFAKYNDT